MAKLKFIYASMNSGKSLTLITKRYTLIERGFNVITLKPSIDTRSDKIETRLGLEAECVSISKEDMPSDVVLRPTNIAPDFILIDEAQFLTREQVENLEMLVDNWGINVIAYGLKLSWKGDFFEGSYHLFRLSDELEQIENLCSYEKGAPALFHMKKTAGEDEVEIGREEAYESVSRKTWRKWYSSLNNKNI